ncbi:hypothetical protein F5141DRAFT_1098294 [Pisolithus sp. B1]|nr:hypothetical protein F5141DRAFT_1098294 [Pisolithus sp. B1]
MILRPAPHKALEMYFAKTFVLLVLSSYVCAQQSCAACPDIVGGLPLFYDCSVDDHTHCGYNDVGGIITSGPVCIYTNGGLLIPAYSDPDICPDSVGSATDCNPCISF